MKDKKGRDCGCLAVRAQGRNVIIGRCRWAKANILAALIQDKQVCLIIFPRASFLEID